ncbi:autotransporter outer membrane beta-barrel domain-containing protein [Thalassovita sp.]|uniref:autotransporter outer membrane beta-barrel domain-containing protein n=1 Tax=Thalassovita sp. TaxID=1979401 RepID=UPI002B26EE47|nr:autotransporter outer membrane beta-barrel domain-containing protein [Thalassovita sp.]
MQTEPEPPLRNKLSIPKNSDDGHDVDSWNAVFGAEKRFNGKSSIGLVAGYSNATADAALSRGSVDGSGVFIAAIGRAAFGKGGAAQAMLGYQDLSFDTTRNVMGSVATGSTSGSQVFAALKGEYMFNQGGFRFGPTGSVEYYDMSVNGFNETGAGAWNLSVGDQSGQVTILSAGLSGEYKLASAQPTKLTGALTYNSASGDDQLVQTGFIGLPSGSTPVDGMNMEWVSLYLGVSSQIGGSAGKETMLNAGYVGSFGSDYDSHALQLSLSMRF